MLNSFFKSAIFFFCFPFLALGQEKLDEEKLKYTLKHDCGSCHGMVLKGGLGLPLNQLGRREWKEIKMIILFGRKGTAMPAWRTLLTDAEGEWLAKYLVQNSAKDFTKIGK